MGHAEPCEPISDPDAMCMRSLSRFLVKLTGSLLANDSVPERNSMASRYMV